MAFILEKQRDELDRDQRAEQDRAWIHFSKNWASIAIGKDWVGRRYLGGGTYGIAALFEYVGDDENVNPRQIVIKQEAGPSGTLKQESHMLSRLMKYKSEHIIKIYRAYHRTFGQGTSTSDGAPSLNPEKDVSRIYLEYAANGDLSHYLRGTVGTGKEHPGEVILPEEAIWRIWECLVKALLVMEKGTEDPNRRRERGTKNPFHHPICHFDIKGGNVLIGGNPRPGHERITFADFGLALEVPLTVAGRRSREWIRVTQARNTYHSPEQRYPDHPNRIISPRSDIWNTAHLIFKAMCNNTGPDTITFIVHLRECGRKIKTVGRRLLNRKIYSRTLRENVLECLAFDPEDRPPATILLQRIQAALQHYENPENRGNPPEWPSPGGPDLRGEDGLDGGRGELGRFDNPSWMNDEEEDEYDHDNIELLYPSRFDLIHGIREMPFETGRIQRPWQQTNTDFRNSFLIPGWDERGRRAEENSNNSSLAAQSAQSAQSLFTVSTSEDNSDGEDIRPESAQRRAYEARIESIRSRPRQLGRSNRGGRAMKGARRQPALRGNGNEGVKRASRGAQAGRANQSTAPPPERRPGPEIAQDSVFDRAQARNVTSGHRGGSSAMRAQISRAMRPFMQAGDDLPDYEFFNPPSQEPQ